MFLNESVGLCWEARAVPWMGVSFLLPSLLRKQDCADFYFIDTSRMYCRWVVVTSIFLRCHVVSAFILGDFLIWIWSDPPSFLLLSSSLARSLCSETARSQFDFLALLYHTPTDHFSFLAVFVSVTKDKSKPTKTVIRDVKKGIEFHPHRSWFYLLYYFGCRKHTGTTHLSAIATSRLQTPLFANIP